MARIVAGVFDDEQTATAVARELRDAGFEAADLDQFAVNPPGRNQGLPLGSGEIAGAKAEGGDAGAGAVKGAAIGSAVGAVAGLAATPLIGPIAIAGGAAGGAYAGSLAGAVKKMGDDRPAPGTRPGGVLVAVNAEAPEDEECAIDLLREHHPRMIERAEGLWRNGKWADFDPVRPPDVVESRAAGDNAANRPARRAPP